MKAAIDECRSLPLVVVYDGACPLCSREIAHYRRRKGASSIEWVDAANDEQALRELSMSRATAMSRFHVRDRTGEWATGAAAFILLWSNLPAYRWLARLVGVLRLTPLMERGYELFLRWRNRRNRCSSACGAERGERR